MIKNERGYALVLVLVVMLALFMLGTALVGISTSQVREAVKQQERVQAYYLAYSGANAVVEWIMAGGDVPEGESASVELNVGSFYLEMEEVDDVLTITSHGTVDGYTETVSVTLTLQSGGSSGGFPPIDKAVFAISDGNDVNPAISISGSRSIIGPMGTNATAENSVSFGAGSSKIVDGHLYLGHNAVPDDVIINSTQSLPGNRTINDVLSEGYEVRTYPELISCPTINFPQYPVLDQRNDLSTNQVGQVSGMITDQSGNPLERIKVKLSQPDGRNTDSQHWAPLGFWSINSVRGRVIVTPVDDNYSFEPACQVVTAPAQNVNFVAIPNNNPTTTCDEEPLDNSTPHWLIDKDGSYDNIFVGSSRKIFFDLDGGERKIVVNNLDISQGFIDLINVGENGILILYVKDTLKFGGSSRLNENGNHANVIIYYEGFEQPEIVGGTLIEGNLIVKQADVFIAGSNAIRGHVFSGGQQLTIIGAADLHTQLFYAPNAHVSVEGSGFIKGAVVANTFSASGGQIAVEFDPPSIDNLPFDIFGDNNGIGNGNVFEKWINPQWSGGSE